MERVINSSKPGGNYITRFDSYFCSLRKKCFFQFHMILRVNSENFLEQHQPVDVCNGDMLGFL
jgi:hypothetical protein